jgi:hypothetical protein
MKVEDVLALRDLAPLHDPFLLSNSTPASAAASVAGDTGAPLPPGCIAP